MKFRGHLGPSSVFLVKALITLGCILQILSLIDCHFVHVVIGSVPSNMTWDHPTIDFGLWFYQPYDSINCQEAPYSLKALLFGENDIVWKVSRVSSVLACVAGGIALVTMILLGVSPDFARYFSVLLLLPLLLSSIFAETAKFIILHSNICQNSVWTSLQSTVTEVSQDCILGRSAYMSLASLASHFIACCFIAASSALTSYKLSTMSQKDAVFVGEYLEFEKSLEDINLDDSSTTTTTLQLPIVNVTNDAKTPRACNYLSQGNVSSFFFCPNITHEAKTPRTCNSSSLGERNARSLFFCPYTATAVPSDEMKRSPAKKTAISRLPVNVVENNGKVAPKDRSTSVTGQQGKFGKNSPFKEKSQDAAVDSKVKNMLHNYGIDAVDLPISQILTSAEKQHESGNNIKKHRIFGPYALDIPSPREHFPTDDVMAKLISAPMNQRADGSKTGTYPC